MVPGQLVASAQVFKGIAGFPKESDFASKVLGMPTAVGGKNLVAGAPVESLSRAGSVIKLSIERGRFKFLKFEDTFSLIDTAGEPFAGGVYLKDFSNLVGKSRIVLFDPSDKPIALAVEDKTKIDKAYDIYGLNPLLSSDTPQEKQGDTDFFPWFRVRDIDNQHLEFRSLMVWNGNNYQPLLRVYPNKVLPGTPAADLLKPNQRDNIVCDSSDPDKIYALMSKRRLTETIAGWDLCIAPGADTSAMIMLAAVLDDMVGWFA